MTQWPSSSHRAGSQSLPQAKRQRDIKAWRLAIWSVQKFQLHPLCTNTIKESKQIEKSLLECFSSVPNQAVKPTDRRARGFKHILKGLWLQEKVQVIIKDFITFAPKRRSKMEDERVWDHLKINRKALYDTQAFVLCQSFSGCCMPFSTGWWSTGTGDAVIMQWGILFLQETQRNCLSYILM